MKVIVTIESFDGNMSDFDFLIPSIPTLMDGLITKLVNLEGTPINIEGLNTIHFTDDYRKELFSFQKEHGMASFATHNKIADGNAQVLLVKQDESNSADDVGYHIFFSKLIPMVIVIANFFENECTHTYENKIDKSILQKLSNEKNDYIRMIRHELAHVEDENNQKQWKWLDSSFMNNDLQTRLRYDAYRLWMEFYACKRSNFIYSPDKAGDEISSLLSNLETAEEIVCDLRWKYNTQEISLNEFVSSIHEYVRSAFIYCCYFMGHLDKLYDYVADKLRIELYPSRFYCFMPEMWAILRKMAETYPHWVGPEVYDPLASVVNRCFEEFNIQIQDTSQGTYYDIPVLHLTTRSKGSFVLD